MLSQLSCLLASAAWQLPAHFAAGMPGPLLHCLACGWRNPLTACLPTRNWLTGSCLLLTERILKLCILFVLWAAAAICCHKRLHIIIIVIPLAALHLLLFLHFFVLVAARCLCLLLLLLLLLRSRRAAAACSPALLAGRQPLLLLLLLLLLAVAAAAAPVGLQRARDCEGRVCI